MKFNNWIFIYQKIWRNQQLFMVW